jgi:hypothetical protein
VAPAATKASSGNCAALVDTQRIHTRTKPSPADTAPASATAPCVEVTVAVVRSKMAVEFAKPFTCTAHDVRSAAFTRKLLTYTRPTTLPSPVGCRRWSLLAAVSTSLSARGAELTPPGCDDTLRLDRDVVLGPVGVGGVLGEVEEVLHPAHAPEAHLAAVDSERAALEVAHRADGRAHVKTSPHAKRGSST